MSRITFYIFLLLLLTGGVYGQKLPNGLYKSDSTLTENFCYIIPPDNREENNPNAVVVLFPGVYDHPFSIFFESDIVQVLNKENYSIIIPVISQKNDKLQLDGESINKAISLISEYVRHTGLPEKTKIILGGFSVGGTRALKIFINNRREETKLNVSHVFTVDPPLDFNRLLNSEKNLEDKLVTGLVSDENKSSNIEDYLDSISIFTYNNLDDIDPFLFENGNLRIYTEPDLEWQLFERKRNMMELHLIDHSIFVNYLNSKTSNQNVELILSKKTGMRLQTNERNPHSWNIIDTEELVKWLKQ